MCLYSLCIVHRVLGSVFVLPVLTIIVLLPIITRIVIFFYNTLRNYFSPIIPCSAQLLLVEILLVTPYHSVFRNLQKSLYSRCRFSALAGWGLITWSLQNVGGCWITQGAQKQYRGSDLGLCGLRGTLWPASYLRGQFASCTFTGEIKQSNG